MRLHKLLWPALLLWACGSEPVAQTEPGADGVSEGDGIQAILDDAHADVLARLDERTQREFAGGPNQRLEQYAAECDLATGVHIPDFKCSNGTEVPTSHLSGT